MKSNNECDCYFLHKLNFRHFSTLCIKLAHQVEHLKNYSVSISTSFDESPVHQKCSDKNSTITDTLKVSLTVKNTVTSRFSPFYKINSRKKRIRVVHTKSIAH